MLFGKQLENWVENNYIIKNNRNLVNSPLLNPKKSLFGYISKTVLHFKYLIVCADSGTNFMQEILFKIFLIWSLDQFNKKNHLFFKFFNFQYFALL